MTTKPRFKVGQVVRYQDDYSTEKEYVQLKRILPKEHHENPFEELAYERSDGNISPQHVLHKLNKREARQ